MKIKILGITAFLSIVLIAGLAGCTTTYHHQQNVKNETGNGIRFVYVRDTGTTAWKNPYDGSTGYKEGEYVGRKEEIEVLVFFDYNFMYSETPPNKPNQDIRIIDYNGRIFTKYNVPIVYNTTIVKPFSSEAPTIKRSDAITFTAQDRHPVLVMQNQTGFPIRIATPVTQAVNNGAAANWSLPELNQNRNITVNYSVNDFTFTKNVNLNADITLPLTEKPPAVTVVNNTGYPVTVSIPFNNAIPNGGRFVYLKPNRNANLVQVTYSIGSVAYTEQVTVNNDDVTLALTKKPPVVTIVNNTGNTVNLVFIRNPDTNWSAQNLLTLQLRPDGTLDTTQAAAQAGERRGSITNRENFRFWLGNVNLKPDRYDIRIDDVQNNSYVKRNVQITNDMTLTFTQSDKS
jgi:hypothetical protein